jgi:glycosyltransferase involved in cell wall biosynthesis
MKVLLYGKPDLFKKLGGDRIQLEQTSKHLKAHGVDITFSSNLHEDLAPYDVVHVFHLDWNPYCYFYIKRAKKFNKPVVFSTVHHNINELKRFDDEFVFDFRRISKFLFNDQFHRDLFKEFYKSLFSPAELWIILYSAFYGLERMYKYALAHADVVLVQTELEAKDLKNTFGVDFKWRIVKNGVAEVYILPQQVPSDASPLDAENYLVCVGRIEPRKNQTSVIKAVKLLREELKQDLKLVLIGPKASKKHFEYFKIFDNLLKQNSWVKYLTQLPYESMPNYYRHAKVGISASWFETTGLTSLEAVFCGANAVAAGERAKEYLGNLAF